MVTEREETCRRHLERDTDVEPERPSCVARSSSCVARSSSCAARSSSCVARSSRWSCAGAVAECAAWVRLSGAGAPLAIAIARAALLYARRDSCLARQENGNHFVGNGLTAYGPCPYARLLLAPRGAVARERAMERASSHTGELLSRLRAVVVGNAGAAPWARSGSQSRTRGPDAMQSSRRRWLRSSTEAAT